MVNQSTFWLLCGLHLINHHQSRGLQQKQTLFAACYIRWCIPRVVAESQTTNIGWWFTWAHLKIRCLKIPRSKTSFSLQTNARNWGAHPPLFRRHSISWQKRMNTFNIWTLNVHSDNSYWICFLCRFIFPPISLDPWASSESSPRGTASANDRGTHPPTDSVALVTKGEKWE